MLTIAKKKNLRERLDAIATNGGAEGALAEIIREMLDVMPGQTEHEANVRAMMEGDRLDPTKAPK